MTNPIYDKNNKGYHQDQACIDYVKEDPITKQPIDKKNLI